LPFEESQRRITRAASRHCHHESADNENYINAGITDGRTDGGLESWKLTRVMEHNEKRGNCAEIMN
jgi:hypothetical protein